jgi:hypothetical protein
MNNLKLIVDLLKYESTVPVMIELLGARVAVTSVDPIIKGDPDSGDAKIVGLLLGTQ